jgi:hypothetical protein
LVQRNQSINTSRPGGFQFSQHRLIAGYSSRKTGNRLIQGIPASANGEIVFHQMFLNLVGNIFALREATFVSAIKANVSRYGMQGNIRANIENHELISETMPVSLAKRL